MEKLGLRLPLYWKRLVVQRRARIAVVNIYENGVSVTAFNATDAKIAAKHSIA